MSQLVNDIADKLSVLYGVRYEFESEYTLSNLYVFKVKDDIFWRIVTDYDGNYIVDINSGYFEEFNHLLVTTSGYINGITKEFVRYDSYSVTLGKLFCFYNNYMRVLDGIGNVVFTDKSVHSFFAFDNSFMLVYDHKDFVSFYTDTFKIINKVSNYLFFKSNYAKKYVSLANKNTYLINLFDGYGNKILNEDAIQILENMRNHTIIITKIHLEDIVVSSYEIDMSICFEASITKKLLDKYRGFILDKDIILGLEKDYNNKVTVISSRDKNAVGLSVFKNLSDNVWNIERTAYSFNSEGKFRIIQYFKFGYMISHKRSKVGILDHNFNVVLEPVYDDIKVLDNCGVCLDILSNSKHNLYLIDRKEWISINADEIWNFKQDTGEFSYIIGSDVKIGVLHEE